MKFTGHERDLASVAGAGDDLDYMHARHYGPVTGRFLNVDAGRFSPSRPQGWNRFTYSQGNPLKYVDPDGRDIVLAAEGNSDLLRSDMVETLRHPSGREALQKIAANHRFRLVMHEGKIMSEAKIRMEMKTTGAAKVTFGETTGVYRKENLRVEPTGANSTIDTDRVRRFHTDSSGVTTIGHEADHILKIMTGGDPTLGDKPSSSSGPAEQFGKSVSEEPADMSRDDAAKLLQEILGNSAQPRRGRGARDATETFVGNVPYFVCLLPWGLASSGHGGWRSGRD